MINTVKKLLHYAQPYHSIIKKTNKRASERASRKDNMPKYKIRAEETIYAIYETEIEAETKEQAEKIALDTCVSDYLNSDLSNSAGDFTIEEIEEIK